MSELLREITPLTQYDCFTVFARNKKIFDFPLHYHEEFELNLIVGGKGVKRIVGDHTEVINDLELVLVGSNLPHGWFTHQYVWEEGMPEIFEITIQFHRNLFDSSFLKRNQLYFIRMLFENAARGISFPHETIERVRPRLERLTQEKGFESVYAHALQQYLYGWKDNSQQSSHRESVCLPAGSLPPGYFAGRCVQTSWYDRSIVQPVYQKAYG
jgi:hypothetical protein